MGVSLAVIGEILSQYNDPEKLKTYIQYYTLAIMHDEEFKEIDVDVEVQEVVKGGSLWKKLIRVVK
jgi:hypothetical protein